MRGQREKAGGIPAWAGLQLLRAFAVVVLVFVVARAAWYPFWAMTADRDELARSWGGPSPFGATVAHWLVAAIFGGVCAGVWLLCTTLLRER